MHAQPLISLGCYFPTKKQQQTLTLLQFQIFGDMLLVKTNPAMGGVVLVLLVHLVSQSSAISIDSVKEHIYRSNFAMQVTKMLSQFLNSI